MVRPCACIHTREIDVHAVDTRLYACVRAWKEELTGYARTQAMNSPRRS